jgi:CheY-like chemotaxis protein
MESATTHELSAPSAVAVFVVEDEPVQRDLLSSFLRMQGYTVFTAANGVSALECLRTYPKPLIVLLDWFMPHMDGIQVLQAIAADAAAVQPHVFIVVTAADYDFRRRLSRDLPAIPSQLSVTVLGKPFHLDDLAARVARAAARLAAESYAGGRPHNLPLGEQAT